MSEAIEISVVVPVRNEAGCVEPLAREIAAALRGQGAYEVVYVDDASEDATLEELLAVRGELPALRILRHSRRCGQSTALHTGVAHARGAWIVTIDGDGQNDPADIPRLLERRAGSEDGARPQLIAGWRKTRRDTWIRRVSSRIANGVRKRLLRDDCPDTGCGLKVVRRDVFLALPYFDHMHRFLPALVRRAGGSTLSVPVNHRPRRAGRSKYGIANRLWVGIVDLAGVIWLRRRMQLTEVEEVS